MPSLLDVILVVLLVIGCFLAYWSGRQDGQKEEFEKNLKTSDHQTEKILALLREVQRLRRERDQYADQAARMWTVKQQHSDRQ